MKTNFRWLLTAVAMCFNVALFAQLSLTENSPKLTEDFNSMYVAGEPSLTLPSQWRVDRHMSLPRAINEWANCSTTVMYSGGVSLAANASNGTYNFGDSADPTDRAVGGIPTGGEGTTERTKGYSIMTSVKNDGQQSIDHLTLSYDIEKYRKGANNAGFVAQLYTSLDGKTWVSAGSDFATNFAKDDVTEGAVVVPIMTENIAGKVLKTDIAVGQTLYLAWNISVVSGTAANAAMALAIDNVSIEAGFAVEGQSYIYVENAAKWKNLTLSINDGESVAAEGTSVVNGVEYTYFATTAQSSAKIKIEGATASFEIENVNLDDDVYLCLSKTGLELINDPLTYDGWVDPDRQPFKSSGIYLRGEINSWGSPAEWEFSDEGNGLYVLYDKTLSGSFKVADASWSSKCNYGSNGEQILMDTPYQLVLGTDANISVGGNTYTTQRIVLTISGSNASLLLESADDNGEIESVYIIGDFNDWNYMDKSGELTKDKEANCTCIYSGTVTLHPAEGSNISEWRLYQGLGMNGVWGASGTDGLLEKGSTANVATEAGTYDIVFDISTGNYTMTRHESLLTSITLEPEEVYLVPQQPEKVRVLSLNNSLINYNNQASVFTQFAKAAGKDALWTPHSILGQPLSTHFNETGTSQNEEHQQPAKDMVRSQAWSHIILQEQSALPRTNPESFYRNVRQWVEFIRQECPNPNAIIILPLNWAYSGDWTNFTNYNKQFLNNYLAIARELGIEVCPVGVAYQLVYDAEGTSGINPWFSDDRHPTNMSTYMAAVMEYAIIYGEDPTSLTWHPTSISDLNAQRMRQYAWQAVEQTTNYVDHTKGIVRFEVTALDQYGMRLAVPQDIQWSLSGGGEIEGGIYTSDKIAGDYTVSISTGEFNLNSIIHVVQAVPYDALQTPLLDSQKNQKILIDGNLYISHNGVIYNALGTPVNAKYLTK